MGDFELETRVEGGGGRYTASLSAEWEIWGPNGGYLAGIALRAAGREARIERPASFSGHFLRVARFAPVEIEVTPLRLGRSSESLRVSIGQDGKAVFEALVRTAREGPGLVHDEAKPPEAPAPEDLPAPPESETHRFWRNFDRRWVKPSVQMQERREPGPSHWVSWHRFRPRATFDDPFVDAARYLLLIDTLTWPAASQPHRPEPAFTAPNIDVTVWFHRADKGSEWLLAEQTSQVAEGGLMGSHGRVFSREGRLLASGGAQLFCLPALQGS